MVQNGSTWSKMAQYGPKWSPITKHGENGQNSTKDCGMNILIFEYIQIYLGEFIHLPNYSLIFSKESKNLILNPPWGRFSENFKCSNFLVNCKNKNKKV